MQAHSSSSEIYTRFLIHPLEDQPQTSYLQPYIASLLTMLHSCIHSNLSCNSIQVYIVAVFQCLLTLTFLVIWCFGADFSICGQTDLKAQFMK